MRVISPQLEAHFGGGLTTLATCWRLTRQDGAELGFTDLDRTLMIDTLEYDSIAGFTPTTVESKSNMSVDNLDLEGQTFPSKITESDLLAGMYDYAEVEIFLVNYEDLSQGKLVVKRGRLGEVTLNAQMFHAEVRGLTQHLSQTIGEVYSPSCRAVLGDSRCKVNLASVTICAELKNRGLNVMFYPMIFVDTITPEPKPWRGRITPASATDANNWFTKTNGYNAFIMHYANLLSGDVDAFVMGSELVGMTGFTDALGSYPAVSRLVTLAGSVKAAMPGTIITYAADWSEYHSRGGWFNLDPLWASSNIDVVGIDSYFPITPDLPQSQITPELITEYWEKGEGWDYYYTDSVARTGLTNYTDAKYAWKNLEYWWKNTHVNPNAVATAWTSKMKPVWFTEFGFPSVDGVCGTTGASKAISAGHTYTGFCRIPSTTG